MSKDTEPKKVDNQGINYSMVQFINDPDGKLEMAYFESLSLIHKYLSPEAWKMIPVTCVSVNNRLRSSLGRCTIHDNFSYCTLEVSKRMYEYNSLYELKQVMIHELLHSFYDSRGHDILWKNRADRLNSLTGMNISAQTEPSYDLLQEKDYRMFRCKKCGKIIRVPYFEDFCKHYNKYAHTNCLGSFETYIK